MRKREIGRNRIWLKACPKCGGDIFDETPSKHSKRPEVACIQCGLRADGTPDELGWAAQQLAHLRSVQAIRIGLTIADDKRRRKPGAWSLLFGDKEQKRSA